MTPHDYNSLCAEHVALKQLALDIHAAIAKARIVKLDLDSGALENAVDDLWCEIRAIGVQMDLYDAREEPSPARMSARYLASVL